MEKTAVLAVPALLLSACSYWGGPSHGAYGADGHAAAYPHVETGRYAAPLPVQPIQNPCALRGDCGVAGGYATSRQAAAVNGYAHGSPGYPVAGLRGLSNPYARNGFAYTTIGAQNFDVDEDLFGAQARLGYQSANIVGAEIEGTLGLNSIDDTFLDIPIDTKIETQFAGFATATLPVGQRLALRGRGGYHMTEVSFAADLPTDQGGHSKTRDTEDGLAWGVGAEYALTPRSGLRADYTRYHIGSGGEALDSVALAYAHRF